MKMIFLKLFLICLFKNPNLAKIFTNLKGKLNKIIYSAEFMKFVFFHVRFNGEKAVLPSRSTLSEIALMSADIHNPGYFPPISGYFLLFKIKSWLSPANASVDHDSE